MDRGTFAIGILTKAFRTSLFFHLDHGTIDNLLCPILVGNRLKQHTVLAFISLVGGLILFGPAGLILGPIVLTITMVLLEIWTRRATASSRKRVP